MTIARVVRRATVDDIADMMAPRLSVRENRRSRPRSGDHRGLPAQCPPGPHAAACDTLVRAGFGALTLSTDRAVGRREAGRTPDGELIFELSI